MTTIAYKNGWLVSDSRETSAERVDTDRCKKIYRLPDGSLYAGSGDTNNILVLHQELIKAIRLGKKQNKKILPNITLKGVNALLVDSKTKIYYFDKSFWQPVNYHFAIGSGSNYALAAMDAGCSAEEAVRIAIKRDVYSGGRLQKYKV